MEVVDGEIPVTLANEAALRQALEGAGVEFIDENGVGPGVRLRRPEKKGDLSGFHSIRINDQWRIIFKWLNGEPHAVQIVDYH